VGKIGRLELSYTAVVFDGEFEHIEHVTVESSAKNKIIRSLLLVVAHCE